MAFGFRKPAGILDNSSRMTVRVRSSAPPFSRCQEAAAAAIAARRPLSRNSSRTSAASEEASPLVRAIAREVVEGLRAALVAGSAEHDPVTRAHRAAALETIAAFAKAPEAFRQPGTLPPPPGMPI